MKTLNHNDKVIINGFKGTVGTLFGFCKDIKFNKNLTEQEIIEDTLSYVYKMMKIDKEQKRKTEFAWVNKEASCICGDKSYYEIERERWSNAIPLMNGEYVIIESNICQVKFKGNYSDMVEFILKGDLR